METAAKKDIRREVLALRNELPQAQRNEKSRRIQERLMTHPAFLTAGSVLCYVTYKSEVETEWLIRESLSMGKRVCCPLVTEAEMEFYEIDSMAELREGFHGILEPPAHRERLYVPDSGDLVIMPGAAFDRVCHRIGYGGGYYDRYLQRAGELTTAALAFAVQVRRSIPWEAHDICPQTIVTENEVIEKKGMGFG